MEAYEQIKERIKEKGNSATFIKQREKMWQRITDRLNAYLSAQITRSMFHWNHHCPNGELTLRKRSRSLIMKEVKLWVTPTADVSEIV